MKRWLCVIDFVMLWFLFHRKDEIVAAGDLVTGDGMAAALAATTESTVC